MCTVNVPPNVQPSLSLSLYCRRFSLLSVWTRTHTKHTVHAHKTIVNIKCSCECCSAHFHQKAGSGTRATAPATILVFVRSQFTWLTIPKKKPTKYICACSQVRKLVQFRGGCCCCAGPKTSIREYIACPINRDSDAQIVHEYSAVTQCRAYGSLLYVVDDVGMSVLLQGRAVI